MDASPATPLTGGCTCGAVRFCLTAPPRDAGWCHCSRCRRRTGGPASVQAHLEPGTFELTHGAERVTEYVPQPGGFVKAFCATCGSHLYSREPGGWAQVSVRFGSFDDDPGVRPSYHQRVESAVPWIPLPDDGLPRFEGRRPPSG